MKLQYYLDKAKNSRFSRIIIRNHRLKLGALLLLFILIVIIFISQLEKASNEPFGSFVDVFYWAVVTISTVGYGDITVNNVFSKILAVVLILTGVLLVSLMTATFASILTATRIREGMGLKKIDLNNHIIICGFNKGIEAVIQGVIAAAGKAVPDIVLVNNHQESENTDLIERFPEISLSFVSGDYTTESTLMRAALVKASSVIILADSGPEGTSNPDEKTLQAILAAKSIVKDLDVCAEVLEAAAVPHIRRAGVDQIVISGEFSGFLMASAVMAPGIMQAFREIILDNNGSNILRIDIPSELIGKTFGELSAEFSERHGYIVIGIITESKSFNLEGILSGESTAIDTFIRRKFDEAGRSLEIETKGRVQVKINPGREYVLSEHDYAIILTS